MCRVYCSFKLFIDCYNWILIYVNFFKPVDEETENIRQNIPPSYLYGSLSIDDFVQRLAQAGFTDPKVEEDIGCTLINLVRECKFNLIYKKL